MLGVGEEGLLGTLRDLAAALCLAAGAFFYLVGAIGLNRMPDVFTRAHAASVSDTLGLGLLLLGMLIHAGFTLVGFKLVAIFALLFVTAPIATHALARAALHDGEQPLLAREDGTASPADLAELFPELERRLEQPTRSETVEPPEEIAGRGAGEGAPSNS